jgi:hypothetical protein
VGRSGSRVKGQRAMGRVNGSSPVRKGKLILDFFITFSYNTELEINPEKQLPASKN